jgi:caffeoyl-CoA O-methyltransferase
MFMIGIDPHIDADKESYIAYHEELIPRLRSNGLLLVDNVLWSGTVANRDTTDNNAEALHRYNDHAAADSRIEKVILPLGDGVLIPRKR